MKSFRTPYAVNMDAYQAGHFEQIPPGMENFQLSHGIFRKPLHYGGDEAADLRLLSGGIAPFLKLEEGFAPDRPLTMDFDVLEGDWFYNDFNLGQPYPWPRNVIKTIVEKYKARVPVCIMGLPDGQTHYVGEPHIQVWTDEPGMGECVGIVESTILPYLWNFSIVATRNRIRFERMMGVFKKAYPSWTDEQLRQIVRTKFHDFGRRGGAISQMTGIASLYVWDGTDTCDSAYAAAKYLNNGEKFGACSVVAAAHRTITPWRTEDKAYHHIVHLFEKGYSVIAIPADSYGFERGIRKLAGFAEYVKSKNGFLVGRPDSGNPVDCVIVGLIELEKTFGSHIQEIGLKVINNAGIIQGDGISDRMMFEQIYPAVFAAGFCPSNVAFGMGEYNHRAVRSDTEHGYKTAMVGTENGEYRESMKGSDSDWKKSIPGAVGMNVGLFANRVSSITVEELKQGHAGDLVVLYDGRTNPLPVFSESFSLTRERVWQSWNAHPKFVGDTYTPALRERQKNYMRAKAGK